LGVAVPRPVALPSVTGVPVVRMFSVGVVMALHYLYSAGRIWWPLSRS
jgi:hypothetical protein